MKNTYGTNLPAPHSRRTKVNPRNPLITSGAPVGIRTPNLLIRSQMLYPIELRVPAGYHRVRHIEKEIPGRQELSGKKYTSIFFEWFQRE